MEAPRSSSALFTCKKGYPRICGGRSWTAGFESQDPGVCVNCHRLESNPVARLAAELAKRIRKLAFESVKVDPIPNTTSMTAETDAR